MPLRRNDLVLAGPTVNHPPFDEHVALAARHGFAHIALFASTYVAARASGRTDADLHRLLERHGVTVADVDCAAPVAGRGNTGEAFFGANEDDVFAAAEALRARSVNVVLRHDDAWSEQAAIDELGRLCERGQAAGLLVHLEPVPFMKIKSLPQAWALMAATGAPNGGVQLDSWHHLRGPARDDDLSSVPAERIYAVQLADAPALPDGKTSDETLHRRRVPGEGELPLTQLVAALDRRGVDAPWSVELFSNELDARPRDEVAGRVANATRSLLAQAVGLDQA